MLWKIFGQGLDMRQMREIVRKCRGGLKIAFVSAWLQISPTAIKNNFPMKKDRIYEVIFKNRNPTNC